MKQKNVRKQTSRNRPYESYLEPFRQWRSAIYSDVKSQNKSSTVRISKIIVFDRVFLCNISHQYGIRQAMRHIYTYMSEYACECVCMFIKWLCEGAAAGIVNAAVCIVVFLLIFFSHTTSWCYETRREIEIVCGFANIATYRYGQQCKRTLALRWVATSQPIIQKSYIAKMRKRYVHICVFFVCCFSHIFCFVRSFVRWFLLLLTLRWLFFARSMITDITKDPQPKHTTSPSSSSVHDDTAYYNDFTRSYIELISIP